ASERSADLPCVRLADRTGEVLFPLLEVVFEPFYVLWVLYHLRSRTSPPRVASTAGPGSWPAYHFRTLPTVSGREENREAKPLKGSRAPRDEFAPAEPSLPHAICSGDDGVDAGGEDGGHLIDLRLGH